MRSETKLLLNNRRQVIRAVAELHRPARDDDPDAVPWKDHAAARNGEAIPDTAPIEVASI